MNKPTLTKEQADKLQEVRGSYKQELSLVENFRTTSFLPMQELREIIDLDTLIRALYIGYTVEQTPVEKVREYFNSLKLKKETAPEFETECSFEYAMEVLVQTLDYLNITIEGVNDK